MKIEVTTNGSLLLTATEEEQEDIREALQSERLESSILADLLEPYSTNGSYTPFDAGQAMPFVGLTEAPCMAEAMEYAEDGEPRIVGRFWYFAQYCIASDLEQLAEHGATVYALAALEILK